MPHQRLPPLLAVGVVIPFGWLSHVNPESAWRYGGTRGRHAGLACWLAAPAGVTYTIAVITVLAIALLAGVILLWESGTSPEPLRPYHR